jgi:hypothetical protein
MSSTPKNLTDKLPREIWKEICIHALPKRMWFIDFRHYYIESHTNRTKIEIIKKKQDYVWVETDTHDRSSSVLKMKNPRVHTDTRKSTVLTYEDEDKNIKDIEFRYIIRIEEEKFEPLELRGFTSEKDAEDYRNKMASKYKCALIMRSMVCK